MPWLRGQKHITQLLMVANDKGERHTNIILFSAVWNMQLLEGTVETRMICEFYRFETCL